MAAQSAPPSIPEQNQSFSPPPTVPAQYTGGPGPSVPPTTPAPQPYVAQQDIPAGQVVSLATEKKSKVPKKLIGIVAAIIGVLLLVFVVTRFLLPALGLSLFESEVELTWWGLWEDGAIVQPLIDEYQAANPNVKITYVAQSKTDYRERLVNSLARGNGPDIFRLHNTWTPMFSSELSTLPSDVMTSAEFIETFYPIAARNLTTRDGIVGIPLEFDALGLFINDEIFSTYGKLTPKTWNEVRETALDLTIRDENGIIKQAGVALGRTENVDHWQDIVALMMLQNGADPVNPTTELAGGALEFFTVFSNTDKVWDATLPSSTAAFAGGKLAMYIAPSWQVFEILERNPSLEFSVVGVPQLPKESEQEPDITYATYWFEGVWDRSDNSEEAWKFLKFMSTKESLEKLYANASTTRLFGEPYPRRDMKNLLLADPILSGFMVYADNATSWYLASRTNDGQSGINTLLSGYFEDAVNAYSAGRGGSGEKALEALSLGVRQILSQYGLASAPPPLEQ